jgi:hypothetical protein
MNTHFVVIATRPEFAHGEVGRHTPCYASENYAYSTEPLVTPHIEKAERLAQRLSSAFPDVQYTICAVLLP